MYSLILTLIKKTQIFNKIILNKLTGLQGKGEGISLTPHCHFHLIQWHLDISREITAVSSPLYMASSQILTRNLLLQWVSHRFQFLPRFCSITSNKHLPDGLKSSVKLFHDDTSIFAIVKDPAKSSGELNSDLKTINH